MAGGRLLLGGDFLSPPPLPPLPPPPLPPLPPPPPEPVLEQWRYSHESDWQWALRRSFICRHLHSYPGAALDQLLALSAAWTNHVFLGCRYSPHLMEKILQMAEGIDIGEMPSYDLMLPKPSKGQKRHLSTYDGQNPPKKQAGSKYHARPRFEPVHFVASSSKDERQEDPYGPQTKEVTEQTHFASTPRNIYQDYTQDSFSVQDGNSQYCDSSGFIFTKDQPVTTNMYFESGNPPPSSTSQQANSQPAPEPASSQTYPESVVAEKQYFIEKLTATIWKNLSNPEMTAGSDKINYTYMLTRCIQACKTNPEYIYAPLKEIPPADIPKNKKLLTDGYACEVRCQNIYLTTGYAGSKNGSRDRATELAVKLLQKCIEVRVVRRKFKHTIGEDLVVCQIGVLSYDFPPALKPPEDVVVLGKDASGQPIFNASAKHWTNFVITENANDAIGILNNSASFNKMSVDYKYEMMPNRTWRCRVFLQDHCLAEGYGTKKTSKHAAADEALKILQKTQPTYPSVKSSQCHSGSSPRGSGKKKDIKDLVVYENSSNPVCTLNDTAQFNRMTIEYVYERMTGLRWKCKVILESEVIAEAVGVKKSVKYEAAGEAVKTLKKTQPTVINNLKKGTVEDVISRNEIQGRSAEEAYKQQIREDNIGNQLLRKMGWTGGGLGKSGEGIREPISVKEQHKREGLGLDVERVNKIAKRDIEQIIRNYARSESHTDLTFSTELTNDERKQIHQIAQKYGLKSKSHGVGHDRYLVVGRKRRKEDLLDQLKQEGQVGHYELVMPQAN
ncbi:NF-kappa-B-repressing factor [Perognathus longimembris pacificus]|uniref:NF-kappa-B-repressing factor n=1 Tax=Perognathus longimembris pacificus TaxID=214514 RepID=UPI002018489A|nr:NF-kappa-B-repressing factor [Perognathus longimembris pacificus]XP_048192051.1 NF-kappa-B-repressing factor [Perognathus longimembris pacificus]